MHIYLYGPPGSGKTTLGRALATALDLPFVDLDERIAAQAKQSIPAIFAEVGESGFREIELEALRSAAGEKPSVIALGGGALLNPQARAAAESSGQVLFLEADLATLLSRMDPHGEERPLLAGNSAEKLKNLLEARADHYASFPLRMNIQSGNVDALAWNAQLKLGAFRVRGMGHPYDVRIEPGGLDRIGARLRECGLQGPVAVISDLNTGGIYLDRVLESLHSSGYTADGLCIVPGEAQKNIQTVMQVWDFFIKTGIERGSTVIALGGGVTGDLTGFAASVFLRGVSWVNVPTTLLAMVDSSIGGKTGIDLPQAKNLVGAFYPPRLVLADPQVLYTLPAREFSGGLAEVVKHGVIADPGLFALCQSGFESIWANLDAVVCQGMAVKLKVIEADPYEKNVRQTLNLGHTIGHGVELASDYQLSHGEAVAIGMVAEARLAERLGISRAGLADQIAGVLAQLSLPVEIPKNLSASRIVQAMMLDKKRAAGNVRFALPADIGDVRYGLVVDHWQEPIMDAERGVK